MEVFVILILNKDMWEIFEVHDTIEGAENRVDYLSRFQPYCDDQFKIEEYEVIEDGLS